MLWLENWKDLASESTFLLDWFYPLGARKVQNRFQNALPDQQDPFEAKLHHIHRRVPSHLICRSLFDAINTFSTPHALSLYLSRGSLYIWKKETMMNR